MAEGEGTNLVEGAFAQQESPQREKPQAKPQYTVKVVKLLIQPVFHILDDGGNIVGETNAAPLALYPGKLLALPKLVAELEREAEAKQDELAAIVAKPIWN